MRLSDFHVKFDNYPLVSQTDELIIVHKYALSVRPILFIGAHKEAVVPIRANTTLSTVEGTTPWTTLTIPTGGLVRVELTDGTNPLHQVTKIQPTSGSIFICIASPSDFNAYFKQFATTP
jgi:hypothetical protein